MILLSVAGISLNAYAEDKDPSPVQIKKGEPSPEDGFWVSYHHYNIIVSGAERLEKDSEAYKRALDACQKGKRCEDTSDEVLWGALGFGAGSTLSLILVIILL